MLYRENSLEAQRSYHENAQPRGEMPEGDRCPALACHKGFLRTGGAGRRQGRRQLEGQKHSGVSLGLSLPSLQGLRLRSPRLHPPPPPEAGGVPQAVPPSLWPPPPGTQEARSTQNSGVWGWHLPGPRCFSSAGSPSTPGLPLADFSETAGKAVALRESWREATGWRLKPKECSRNKNCYSWNCTARGKRAILVDSEGRGGGRDRLADTAAAKGLFQNRTPALSTLTFRSGVYYASRENSGFWGL